eukprot:jgi/Tetstr1/425533/TSEL_001544.t1
MVVGGAPPGILEDVATAAADKVGHAAASLQVARLLRGGAQSAKAPGRLPQQLGAPRSLRDLAAAVLQEGCLEETMVREVDRAAVRKAMVSVLVAPRLEGLLQTNGDGRATAVSPSSAMTALLEVDGSAAEAARVMMSAIEAALGHRGQEVLPKGRAGRGSRVEQAGSSGAVSAGDESKDTER